MGEGTGLVPELEPLRVRIRRRRKQMIVASLLGGLLLWLGSGFSFHARVPTPRLPSDVGRDVSSHYDRGLSHVVSRIAGRRAVVYCWSPQTWTDHVEPIFGTRSAWRAYTEETPLLTVSLSPEVCGELLHVEALGAPLAGQGHFDAAAWSVSTLAHESMHASGILDERVAECFGMQAIPATAELLGLSAADGRLLARRYWERFYGRSGSKYRSSECRDGGLLDRRPRVHAWP